jgi:tellurite resistance protein
MSLKIDTNREAFLAVLSVVAAADQIGSLEERDFLFQSVKEVELFTGQSQAEFNKLLGAVTQHLYDSLPNEDGAITAAGVDQLLSVVKQKLSAGERASLLEVAEELAESDDETDEEAAVLTQIKGALGG